MCRGTSDECESPQSNDEWAKTKPSRTNRISIGKQPPGTTKEDYTEGQHMNLKNEDSRP